MSAQIECIVVVVVVPLRFHFGSILGLFGAILSPLGAILGHLGAILDYLGPSWGHLEATLGP